MPFDRRKLHTLALTLTSSIVLAAAAASPAHADGGRGGDGFSSGGTPATGGAGGGEGANGQSGSSYDHYDADAGGGGGGGGAGGGAGGSGGSAMNNGGGAAGQDGASSTTYLYQGAGGGGGGNGGIHGGSLSGFQSTIGDLIGANGGAAGNGGNTTNSGSMAGGGGGGGAGGYGLVMTGASSSVSLTSSGSATGGNGGSGGRGGTASGGSGRGGNGGSGGDGGVGINFTDTGSLTNRRTILGGIGGTGGAGGNSSDYTGGNGGNGGAGGAGVRFDVTGSSLNNNSGGLIQGGNGGTGGAGGTGSSAGSTGLGGVGGAGVIGAGMTIINGGSIVGGLGADGTRADAITFTGGANYLRLLETSSLTGNIGITAAGSVVSFDHRADLTLANVITGLGGISMATFAEKLTLTGDNTYTGGTVINSGRVLQVGAGGTTGSILGDVANGGTLIFDRSDAVTFNGIISGSGTVTKSGGGTLTLTNDQTYSGGTTISAGTLQVGTGGTAGSILGDVANNGTLAFNRSDAVTFQGAISGTGGVTKNGNNTLTLTGASTYAGQTSLMSGTLRQGAAGAFSANSNYVTWGFTTLDLGNNDATIGGLSGSGRVELGGHVLTVGANNDGSSFAGTLANGDLVKIGSGNLSLDGRASNLASVRVDGGTLSAGSDELASTRFTVNAGATLSGYGTVGTTTINGGTLSPGGGPATLTVQGNLSFTAASTYRVEVTPQESGRVNVSGTAALGGAAVNAVFLPAGQTKRAAPGHADVYVAKQYTILNATGGIDGKFGSLVNTDLPSGFKTGLSCDNNNTYLDLALDFTPTPSPTAPVYVPLNGNQGNVGKALIGYFDRTGRIPLVFGLLDELGLSQISGETAAGSQQTSYDATNMFMTMMTDPFAPGRGDTSMVLRYADDAMAYAPKRAATDAFASMARKAPPMAPAFQERWNVWAAGFGGSQTTDGNAATGSNNSKSSIYGMSVGADYWFSPFTVAGISMAGGGTNFSVNGGGSGRSDLFQLGGFVRHNIGSVYVSAAAAYGWQDITTDRTVTVAGLDQLRANFNANSYSGRVEVGNRFVAPWIGGLGLTPYAAFQVTAFDLPSYAESVVAGSNMFALTYAGKTVLSPRSELGLRTDKSFAVNDAILTLRGRAAWAHDTNRDRSASATFQSLPGASFIVDGASLAKHTALTSASAELKWMNGWSVAGTFEGEFSDVTESYAGKGVVRYAW